MDHQFLIAVSCLIAATLIGLNQARKNLQDSEAVQARLQARRLERLKRKQRWNWPT